MKIYVKYIIKSLSMIFCTILFTLAFILWLSQILKLIYVIEKGIGILSFLKITAYLLPTILNSMMPISSLLSVLYLHIEFRKHREFIAFFNSGLDYFQIIKASLIFSLMVTTISLFFTLYLMPVCYANFKKELTLATNNFTARFIEEKTFNNIFKNLTLYVDRKDLEQTLYNIIIFDTRFSDIPKIIIAKSGKLHVYKNSLFLNLNDGIIQNFEKKIESISFSKIELDFTIPKINNNTKESQEKNLFDLLWPEKEQSPYLLTKYNKLRAEGHQRLIWPFLNICVTLVALSLYIPFNFKKKVNLKYKILSFIIPLFLILLNFLFSNIASKNPFFNIFAYLNIVISSILSIIGLKSRRGLYVSRS